MSALVRRARVRTVANLTRDDGRSFFSRPPPPLRVETRGHPLEGANEALDDLRSRRVHGAPVLAP